MNDDARASIRTALVRRALPQAWRRALRAAALGLDGAFLALPLAALLLRWKRGIPSAPESLIPLALVLLIPLAIVVFALLRRRGDPRLAARSLDRELGAGELLLTALAPLRASRWSPLLFQRARSRLASLPRTLRPKIGLRLPSFGRAAITSFLAVLILFLPISARGLVPVAPREGDRGEERSGEGKDAGDALSEESAADPAEAAQSPALDARVRLDLATDKSVYLIGEEIELHVQATALSPGSEIALELELAIDAEAKIALHLDDPLPAEEGSALRQVYRLKGPLEEIGRYKRGLVTIDAHLHSPDLEGQATGNRITLQISERTKRNRTQTPRRVEEPKPKPEEKKKPQGGDSKKEPKPKPLPQPQPGKEPAPSAPEEIKTESTVIEPLFAGDHTSKRKLKIYDRDPVRDEREPPKSAAAADINRAYQATEEAEIIRVALPPSERSLVRRYMESIRRPEDGNR